MDRTFNKTNNKTINYKDIGSFQHTQDTFKAFVDAIIPRTPRLADEYGKIQLFGALDFHTDEYLIMTLNNLYIPLAKPIAELLDIITERFIAVEKYNKVLNFVRFPAGGKFAALPHEDLFRVLIYMVQNTFLLEGLPVPFQDNPEFVLSIVDNLNRYTMMGYYSEWFGYGSTRLETPNNRILEFYPLSWKQIGYPGPSLGYRALRD